MVLPILRTVAITALSVWLGGLLHSGESRAAVSKTPVLQEEFDGQEVGRTTWTDEGMPEFGGGLGIGFASSGDQVEPAFLFPSQGLFRNDRVAYARIRVASFGGMLPAPFAVKVRGLLRCDSAPFDSDHRPSQFPATDATVSWDQATPWIPGASTDPMFQFSPDLAPILNEILASDCWPEGSDTGTFALSFRTEGNGSSTFQSLADFGSGWPEVQLEIYSELEDAFLALPLLVRLTDTSVSVNFAHFLSLDGYVAFGLEPGAYQWAQGQLPTVLPEIHPFLAAAPRAARTVRLTGLEPDTRYFGALYYRQSGTSEYVSTPEFSFHTQRLPGASFRFDVLADSHLEDKADTHRLDDLALHDVSLRNVAEDNPDFLVHLGDFAIVRHFAEAVRTGEEARRIYGDLRGYLGSAGVSTPFYLVLGNHEGELGWDDDGGEELPFSWGTRARKEFFPNPEPGAFYSGNDEIDPRFGLLQNYYAWNWGDALFVVLDPFRYTTTKPHGLGGPGSQDGWDWTLGLAQYNWLVNVLESSDQRWKFVFTHHLVGGVEDPVWGPYGRGGIEGVRYRVAGRPSYEWGGEDLDGSRQFDAKRPGFLHGDIHSILVQNGVNVVFHGHDHLFAHQEIDGVVYQECPMPSDANYGIGFIASGHYMEGTRLPCSGHLRVDVSEDDVRVDYVRSFLPGDGVNGDVAHSYIVGSAANVPGSPEQSRLGHAFRIGPTPARGSIRITARRAVGASAEVALVDVLGRVSETFVTPVMRPGDTVLWELGGPGGARLPNGVYRLRIRIGEEVEIHPVVLLE